jgi:hypothetical protein
MLYGETLQQWNEVKSLVDEFSVSLVDGRRQLSS